MARMNKTIFPHNIAHYDTAVLQHHVNVLHAPSLTRKLRELNACFSVHLLYQGKSTLHKDEHPLLPTAQHPVYCREVFLCLNDTPVISARSVCFSGSHYWRNILDCGTRPLGEKLFSDDTQHIERTAFHWQLLPIDHPLLRTFNQPAWARRSIFYANKEPLLLSECFLPNLIHFL